MMMNLFSIFDPSSSIASISWMCIMLTSILIPSKIWKCSPNMLMLTNKIIITLKKEISFTMVKSEKSSQLMILSLFLMILSMNFLALYPQIFSPTSHMVVNLPMSLSFWLSLMMFGWMKNTSHMLSHLVPQGTPTSLMMFMVVIEMISNLIRPITLCVRLTANMIAGHLLMTLLGNSLMKVSLLMMPISITVPIILTLLESAVACVQAYVFMTLITLYMTELKYWH